MINTNLLHGFNLKRFLIMLTLLIVGAMSLSGCYWSSVQQSQMGIITDRGQVTDVVGPGGHQSINPFAGLTIYDGSSKTFEWSDPDLVTADKQPIGVSLAVTVARKTDRASIDKMWSQYNAEATNDESLAKQVLTRIPAIAKTVTVTYSLDQLLGTGGNTEAGRSVVTLDLFNLLTPELDEVGIALLDVRVTNFAPDEAYLNLLKEKAQVGIQREIAAQRTGQLEEQLKQEQAQTNIDLEKARRQNQVNAELSKVYDTSDRYYELERLKLLKEVVGPNDKIYFVPEGADLTMYLAGQSNAPVPVPAQQPEQPAAPPAQP